VEGESGVTPKGYLVHRPKMRTTMSYTAVNMYSPTGIYTGAGRKSSKGSTVRSYF